MRDRSHLKTLIIMKNPSSLLFQQLLAGIMGVFITLGFLFVPSDLYSQSKTAVQGIIFEIESEMPLSGAHVMINGSSYGTISGPDGSFRLIISEFPSVLKVSHIGFEDRLFTVSDDNKEDEIMLGLKFSAELLEGVTISDEMVEVIFKSPSYAVLDFEFHENGLMLLIYRNRLKRSELVLLSYMNDTLASCTHLPGRAKSLHRDCRENIHYVAYDSAYQIYYAGDNIELLHPIDILNFLPVASAFAAYYEDNYYYGVRGIQNQVIRYMRYDSVSNAYYPFKMVADEKTLKILGDNPMHFYLLGNLVKSDPQRDFNLMTMGAYASAEDQRLALHLERDAMREAHYLRECVYKPVYAPLFNSGEVMLVFNHPKSQIEFLTPEGVLLKETPIKYHEKANWGELILKDDVTGKYYTHYVNSNRASIKYVDINTGLCGESNILHYPFVKKILIRNGYAYFTYRQPGSVDRTMLFRQKLKDDKKEYARSGIN